MNMRSTRSTVTFSNPFTLPGYPGDLPAGDYEVLVEEELLQGLSFEAYRRTATYLTVRGKDGSHSRCDRLFRLSRACAGWNRPNAGERPAAQLWRRMGLRSRFPCGGRRMPRSRYP